MFDIESRKKALAQYLGLDEEESKEIEEYGDFELSYNREEYLVLTDEEADEKAHESVLDMLENDLGLEALSESAQEYCLENFSTYDWESDMHEMNVSYANDISDESGYGEYANRLVEEAIDRGVISEDDCTRNEDDELEYDDMDNLVEMFADYMDNDYSSMSEWLDSIYGSDWAHEAKDLLSKNIDWDAVADYVIESDGRSPQLASYDHKENEETVDGETWYIYRTN